MPVDRLLERDFELAEFGAACRSATAGDGGVMAVRAAAGVGKTTLLEAALRLAAEMGFATLRSSGTELERELAFGVVRQLFERPVRTLVAELEPPLLSGAAALAVPVVLEPSAEQGSGETAHAAMHGLYWLAAEMAARRPLLLVVDDAHWADTPSLRWLAYLGRRLEGVPLLVIVAYRPGEPGAETDLVEQTLEEASANVLEPESFSEQAVASWVEQAYGTSPAPEFVRACATATAGNPFLLRELIASLRDDGLGPDAQAARHVAEIAPAGIARSVLPRVARMGQEAVAIAEATAVLGVDARFDRIARVAGVALEPTADVVERLIDAAIFAPGEPVRFRHPLMHSAVYGQTPQARRGLAHLTAARRLLDDGGGPERASAHLLLTAPAGRPWVSEALRAAAASALARGAPDVAVSLLRRAVEEPPGDRVDALLELAAAELTAGDTSGAVSSGRAATAHAHGPAQRWRAAMVTADALRQAGDYRQGLEVLGNAAGDAAALDPASQRAHQVATLALLTWKDGIVDLDRQLGELDLESTDVSNPTDRLLLAVKVVRDVASGRPPDRALQIARSIIAAERLDSVGAHHAVFAAPRCLGIADEADEAIAVLDAILDGARARGARHTVAYAAAMRAEINFRTGRLDDAEADAVDGLALWPSVESEASLAYLVRVFAERGRLTEAFDMLRRYRYAGEFKASYTAGLVLHARGLALAGVGDLEAAVDDLRACGRAHVAWGELNPAVIPWRSDLALVLGRRDREEAVALAEEELRLAERFGTARAIGVARRARALLEQGEGQIQGLREAVAILQDSPARLDLARAQVDLGAALRRVARRVEARDTLARGLDEADRCGAHALASRARDELKAAGARPRRDRLSGAGALTASERRVAELAARGLSNRQIAQALFVTAKTVETHLGRVYAKLGVTGRSQLAAALDADR